MCLLLLIVSSPPRNVSYANVTAHSVVVSWLKPLEVHGTLSKYNVSLLASDNTHTTGVSVGKEDLSVRVEKLFPYTQYDVRVQVGVIRQYSNELLWSDPNSEIVKFTTNQHCEMFNEISQDHTVYLLYLSVYT